MATQGLRVDGAEERNAAVVAMANTFLPPFANDENRALDAGVREKTKSLHLVYQEKVEVNSRFDEIKSSAVTSKQLSKYISRNRLAVR